MQMCFARVSLRCCPQKFNESSMHGAANREIRYRNGINGKNGKSNTPMRTTFARPVLLESAAMHEYANDTVYIFPLKYTLLITIIQKDSI